MKHKIKVIEPTKNGQSYTIYIDGQKYPSLRQLPICYVTALKIKSDLNCSLEEAIDTALVRKEDREKARQKKLEKLKLHKKEMFEKYGFTYQGIEYRSVANAIFSINKMAGRSILSTSNVLSYARRHNISKQEAIDMYIEKIRKREPNALALYDINVKRKATENLSHTYCYYLDYFYDRKNCGTWEIKTEKEINEFLGDDEFLDYLVEEQLLSYSQSMHVVKIGTLPFH